MEIIKEIILTHQSLINLMGAFISILALVVFILQASACLERRKK